MRIYALDNGLLYGILFSEMDLSNVGVDIWIFLAFERGRQLKFEYLCCGICNPQLGSFGERVLISYLKFV